MKNIKYIIPILLFFLSLTIVYAGQITVPSSNGPGFLLQSTTTGNYLPVSLTAGSNINISTTTTNITISSTGGGGLTSYDAWTHPYTNTSATTSVMIFNGFTSNASSTISSNLFLANLSQGSLFIGTNGIVNSVATSTPSVTAPITYSGTLGQFIGGASGNFGCTSASSGVTGCLTGTDWNTFNGKENVLTFSAPLNRISNTISWTGLATTSQPASSNILVSNGGAGVYGVATSTLTPSSPLTGSFTQIGSSGSLGCQTASGSQAGCLASSDWTTFNNKLSAYDAWTHPSIGYSATTSTVLIGTSTLPSIGQVTIASSTAPQLSLSQGAGIAQIVMRAENNTLAIASTTIAGTATSSPSALELNTGAGTTAAFGIATSSPFAILSAVSTTANTPLFVLASSTAIGAAYPNFEIDQNGHPIYGGAHPKCDANCTLTAGNDARFRITVGTSITSTTVTFANSWGLAPLCFADEGSAGTVTADASSTPTTVVITLASALTSKDIEVHCDGIQN